MTDDVTELDDMLLRLDLEEGFAAFDEHMARTEVYACFREALAALTDEGGNSLLQNATDALHTHRLVMVGDYFFRLGLLVGTRMERGETPDFDGVAAAAATSIDEQLPRLRERLS